MFFSAIYHILKPKLFLLFIGFISLFIFFPQIDIMASKVFFIKSEFIGWNWHIKGFNGILIKIIIFLLIIASIYNVIMSYYQKNIIKHISYIFVLLVGMHLLVVHSLAKNFFGRPRPQQIIEFGGKNTFSPAFYISNQCKTNCSFVSGDTSIAFTLFGICIAMPITNFITRKRKSIILDCTFLIGIIMSLCRVSLGRHFLSDVFWSMFITIAAAFYFYRLIFGAILYKDLENNL